MKLKHLLKNVIRPATSPNTDRRKLIKGSLLSLAAVPLLANRASANEYAEPTRPGDLPKSKSTPRKPLPRSYSNASYIGNFGKLFESIKRNANDDELYRFLYAMPKGGDLHHHLGGGFLPYSIYAIAADKNRNGGQRFYTRFQITDMTRHPIISRSGVSYIFDWLNLREETYLKLPKSLQKDFKPLDQLSKKEQADWMSSVVLDNPNEGRNEFFEYHWSRLTHILQSIHVSAELLVENMKLFGAEGVTYLEIQRGAFGYVDEKANELSPEVADSFWAERLQQADALATGVIVRWQGIVVRFLPNAEDMVRAYFAHIDANRDHWVGLNMAGREDDNRGHPLRFKKVFDEMLGKYPGIGLAIRAGEAEKNDSHIFDTLRLGATRIGHGINLFRDEPTFQMMKNGAGMIEINLISNELLGYVPNLDEHPFPLYLRHGIPCCLNTDDRGMWDSNYTDELFVAVKRFNLSWEEINRMNVTSYERSFAEPEMKDMLLAQFRSDLKAFEAKFSDKNWKQPLTEVTPVTHGYGKRVLKL
jgi:adenosine deaminase CECR1